MIRKVKVENWRSHWETELEFSEGTNALIGLMGSGKSSILSAISFGLFGTFPALKSREVTLDDLIMKKPQKKEKASVSVVFDLNGDNYKVKREIEKDKGTTLSEIRKNGRLLDTGVTRTTELVEKYLKVDYDLFSRAIYSEQNGLHYFLEIPKGKRMKRIDQLLRLDRFEKARESSTTLINRMKDRSQDREKMLEEMEEKEDFNKLENFKKEIDKMKAERNELKEKEENLKQKIKNREKQKKEFKKERKKLEKIKKDKNRIEGQISGLKKNIKDTKEKFEDVEVEIEEIENKIENLEKNKKELEKKLETKRSNLESIQEEKQKIKAKIKNLQSRIEKLKEVKGKCPICDNDLTEKHREKLLSERYDKIEKLEKEISKHKKKIEATRKKISKLENKKEEIREKIVEFKPLSREREDLKEKENKLKEFQEKLKDIEKNLKKIKEEYNEERFEELQTQLRELSSKKSQVESKLESNKQFISDKKERLEELKERKEMFEKYKKDVEKLNFLIEDVKKFRNALEKTQFKLREEFVKAVNSTMNEIWETLYPYEDYTGISLDIKEGDYRLKLRESGGDWVNVEGVVSGGERTSACLTLRIAFALVLAPNLKWLVLDEPTHNLDSRAVEDLAKVLKDKVTEFVNQVFLITHEKKLEDAVTGYLYIFERNKEEDEPTQAMKAQTPRD